MAALTQKKPSFKKPKYAKFEIRATVGLVSHNLLAVSQLARSGNTFHWDNESCSITCGWRKVDCLIWSGVPWVHAKVRGRGRSNRKSPDDMEVDHDGESEMSDSVIHRASPASKHSGKDPGSPSTPGSSSAGVSSPSSPSRGILKLDGVSNSDCEKEATSRPKYLRPSVKFDQVEIRPDGESEFLSIAEDVEDVPLPDWVEEPSGSKEDSVDFPKLQKRIQEELVLHRRRGRMPFESRCTHCVNTRSVFRHPRQEDERKNLGPSANLIQCDLFYLGEPGKKEKFLALAEAMTGLIGFAYCGTNVESTVRQIKHFFNDLGLLTASADSVAVEVLTDAEAGVGALLRHIPARLIIRKAAPQQHQTVGRVERCVRKYKEMFECICLDLKANGFQLKHDVHSIQQVLSYISQTNNAFGTGASEAGGNRRSPHELCCQKSLAKPVSTVFGFLHAEVTDSIREKVAVGSGFSWHPIGIRNLAVWAMSLRAWTMMETCFSLSLL